MTSFIFHYIQIRITVLEIYSDTQIHARTHARPHTQMEPMCVCVCVCVSVFSCVFISISACVYVMWALLQLYPHARHRSFRLHNVFVFIAAVAAAAIGRMRLFSSAQFSSVQHFTFSFPLVTHTHTLAQYMRRQILSNPKPIEKHRSENLNLIVSALWWIYEV